MESLQKSIPERDYEENFDRLRDQFHSGFLDSQLQTLLETAAPPVNLLQVQFVRPGHDVEICLGFMGNRRGNFFEQWQGLYVIRSPEK